MDPAWQDCRATKQQPGDRQLVTWKAEKKAKKAKKARGIRSTGNLADEAHKSLRRKVRPTKEIHKILPRPPVHRPHFIPKTPNPPVCSRVSALCTFVLL